MTGAHTAEQRLWGQSWPGTRRPWRPDGRHRARGLWAERTGGGSEGTGAANSPARRDRGGSRKVSGVPGTGPQGRPEGSWRPLDTGRASRARSPARGPNQQKVTSQSGSHSSKAWKRNPAVGLQAQLSADSGCRSAAAGRGVRALGRRPHQRNRTRVAFHSNAHPTDPHRNCKCNDSEKRWRSFPQPRIFCIFLTPPH